jgi:parvulin-like peptidyl-prolyl isomerase
MSLMGMNRAFKKHGALWGGAAAALMLIVAVSGLGNNFFRNGGSGPTPQQMAEAPVATVGDTSVTRGQLDQQVDALLRQQMGMTAPPSPAEMDRYRYLLLSRYKDQAALVLAAKAAGITVSDEEMTRERDKRWALQRGQIVNALGLDAKATDADIEKALAAQQPGLTVAVLKQRVAPDDAVRAALYQQGLTNLAKKNVAVTEDAVKKSYDEIQVRHILIKTGQGGLPDDKAKEKALKVLAEVQADPSKMASLAMQYSDDPGSKAKGGLYDWAPANRYVPEFTKGALDAGIGKVNPQPIKTSFGYHIIKLEGERPGKDFPKDWDKNKQKYIDQYTETQAAAKAKEAVDAQLPNVKVTVLDPGMKAAELQQDAEAAPDPNTRNAKLNEALTELNKIKKVDDRSGAAPLRRADILMQLNRPKEAIAAYEEALTYRNSVETRLSLAQLYQAQKDNSSALKQVQEAQKLAVSDVPTEVRVATLLDTLGDKAGAQTARDKAAEMQKRQAQIDAAERAASAPPVTATPAIAGHPVPTATAAVVKPSAATRPSTAPSASATK